MELVATEIGSVIDDASYVSDDADNVPEALVVLVADVVSIRRRDRKPQCRSVCSWLLMWFTMAVLFPWSMRCFVTPLDVAPRISDPHFVSRCAQVCNYPLCTTPAGLCCYEDGKCDERSDAGDDDLVHGSQSIVNGTSSGWNSQIEVFYPHWFYSHRYQLNSDTKRRSGVLQECIGRDTFRCAEEWLEVGPKVTCNIHGVYGYTLPPVDFIFIIVFLCAMLAVPWFCFE